MKKLLISVLAFTAFVFPLLAQIDHDFNVNDRVPVVNTIITRDQVPAAVIKGAETQLDLNNTATWSKFPYALKEYGWVYDVGASDIKLDRYEVTMKNKEGHDLWAVYSADGQLIESREASNNVAMPLHVQQALAKSQYKDWKVVGDKEIIKYYFDNNKKNVEEHFRLTVEKDGTKKAISFNFQNEDKK